MNRYQNDAHVMTAASRGQSSPGGDRGDGDVDVSRLLAAWQTATERLQRTHETLRAEVCRLTDELEKKNRELARKNRLADLGHMASHIAHEVRNELMPMTLYLSLLRRHLPPASVGLEVLDKLEAGFSALDATVNDLLHFTGDRDPQWSHFGLRELAVEVSGTLAPQLAAQGVALRIDVPGDLLLRADREMLRRALLNLILNALDVLAHGGDILLTACHAIGGVEIEVADTGPGLPAVEQDRLFEPFFTTKSGGTGLGLAIVGRVAEIHGGNVRATNCPEGGAALTICIPHGLMEAAA